MKFIQSCAVEEVLSKYKLPGAKFYDSMAESYRLYTTGLSVQEIAKERHLSYSTIFCHLCDSIKFGKPVKLADLTVTKYIKNTIISVIRAPLSNSEMSSLKSIKDMCPKTITFNQIQAVTTFLEVCAHLDQLNCEYEDFKNAVINGNALEEPESDGEGEKMIKELDSLVDELAMDGAFLSKAEVNVTDNYCEHILTNFENQNLCKSQDSLDKRTPNKCESLNEGGFYDFTEDSHIFLAALDLMGGQYGVLTLSHFLKGSKWNLRKKLRSHALFGSGKHKSHKWWECIGHILQREGYLESQIKGERRFLSSRFHVSAKGKLFLRNIIERPESTKVLLKPSQEMRMLPKRKRPIAPDFVPPLTSRSVNITSSDLLQEDSDTDTENLFENETRRQKRMHFCNVTLSPNLLQKDKNTSTQNLIENETRKQERLPLYDLTLSPNLLQKDKNSNTQNLMESETRRHERLPLDDLTLSPNLLQKDKNANTENLIENETRRPKKMRFYAPTLSPNLLQNDKNTNTQNLKKNETGRQARMHLFNQTLSPNLLQENNENFTENETRKQDRMHFYNPLLSPNALQKGNNTNTENLMKSETEKQEIMHLYKLLLMKRTEIASRLERMPYMIASTEALMKMARLKPHNLDALRKCQGKGFTDDQIMKFGNEFIKVIPSTTPPSVEEVLSKNPHNLDALRKCQKKGFTADQIMKFGDEFIKVISSTPPPSIDEVLSKNPLIKLTAFAAECHRLYTTGLPIRQIANQKRLAFSIILSHLCDCIKAGKPVNLADLTVTKNARKKIIRVIRSPFVNSNMTALTAIKNRCPEDITYNQIRAVVAFLQVCDHLDKFHCEYEAFKNAMIKPKYSAAK